jgi:hypothetical protein
MRLPNQTNHENLIPIQLMPNQINQTKQTKRFTPMKTQKFALLIALFSLLSLGACKDKDKDVKPDKKAVLSEKTWKPAEVYHSGQPVSNGPIFSMRMTFNANETYTMLLNNTTITGVWEFNNDQSKVLLDKGTSDASAWDIVNLEKGKFNFKAQFDTDDDGYLENFEFKMAHTN